MAITLGRRNEVEEPLRELLACRPPRALHLKVREARSDPTAPAVSWAPSVRRGAPSLGGLCSHPP